MYRVVRLDRKALAKQAFLILLVSFGLTILGRILSQPAWVKEGENFILFFAILVGTLLYGFSVATVFQAGQNDWNELVEAVEVQDIERVEQLMSNKPRFFPTLLVVLGWTLLSLYSMF